MHRTEGDNNISNLFTNGPPGAVVNAEWLNSVQEEIAGVVEGAGLTVQTKATDKYSQLLAAIQQLTNAGYDAVINSQADFNEIVERTGANAYQIKDAYSSVLVKNNAAGYLVSGSTSFLSDGDSYGVISINVCKEFKFEPGAFINNGDTGFYFNINADHAKISNVWIKGAGGMTVATQAFLLAADYVLYENCMVSGLISDASFTGFEISGTASNNDTVLYRNCKVFNCSGAGYRNGFSFNYNLDNCFDNGVKVVNRVEFLGASQVGADFPIPGGCSGVSLATLNGTDLAMFGLTNDDLRVYRFGSAGWAQVGNDLNIANAANNSGLAALNSTDVAYIEGDNTDLRTYRFDGTDWAQVGNDLNIPGLATSHVGITALNGTDVVICDSVSKNLTTYRFDGTDWAQVGNSLNIAGVGDPDLTALSESDIAFLDDVNADLRTYRFDGTDWTQVGNDLNIPGFGGNDGEGLSAFNSTDISLIDGTTEELRAYRFDGTDWTQVGIGLDINLADKPGLAVMNGTDVAYLDYNNDDLRLYRYAFHI